MCVIDESGRIVFEGKARSDPDMRLSHITTWRYSPSRCRNEMRPSPIYQPQPLAKSTRSQTHNTDPSLGDVSAVGIGLGARLVLRQAYLAYHLTEGFSRFVTS